MFKRILCTLAVFSFLLTSFAYAEIGVLKKTGVVGATVQGAKLGKRGLKELTKYGQRLVTDDNKTEEELEHFLQQQTAQTSQNSKQETNQNNNKGILDNIASSVSDSADELKTIIDTKTKPLQDTVTGTVTGVGQLFSKVKDKVSGSDKESEVIEEQSETLSSRNKNDNGESEGDKKNAGKDVIKSGSKIENSNSNTVIQSGGNTIKNNTAKELNDYFGTNKNAKEWGDALEELKKENLLRGDHHGKILKNGDYIDSKGNIVDNIFGYLK